MDNRASEIVFIRAAPQPSFYYSIFRDVFVDLVKTIQNKEMCEHLYINKLLWACFPERIK